MSTFRLTDSTTAFFNDTQELLERKNADYRSPEDQFAGFTEVAEALGVSFEEVWAVFFYKHIRSVINWAKDPNSSLRDESIKSRLQDIAAYAAILHAWNVHCNRESA